MFQDDNFLKDRIVPLGTPIDDKVAETLIATLLYLEKLSPDQSITMYINSPGGSATAGLAILDVMESLKPRFTRSVSGKLILLRPSSLRREHAAAVALPRMRSLPSVASGQEGQ